MAILKRIKNLIALSRLEAKEIVGEDGKPVLQLDYTPEIGETEFLSDMTEAEEKEYEEEQGGIKGWLREHGFTK